MLGCMQTLKRLQIVFFNVFLRKRINMIEIITQSYSESLYFCSLSLKVRRYSTKKVAEPADSCPLDDDWIDSVFLYGGHHI